jgi:cation diffusion facilitator family transporter
MTNTEIENSDIAQAEKNKAAGSSVVAAIFLTTFKIIVGVATGSLGILAEAAHSGLDFIGAIVTFVAVRISGKPPDRDHHFGHGKVENVSALFVTGLLLATCVWIIYEVVQRLFYKSVEVEPNAWAFIVMGISIVVDIGRSRVLYRAARKYNSQALEADGLHFSTDVWSSAVVLLGLGCILIGKAYPQFAFLEKADAVAAFIVALIVVYVSIELGIRSVKALLDTAPPELAEEIMVCVSSLPGITRCGNIRILYSGPNVFVVLTICIEKNLPLFTAHEMADNVEVAVRGILPGANVSVHAEPELTEIISNG